MSIQVKNDMNFYSNGIQHIGLPTTRFNDLCLFYKSLGFICRFKTNSKQSRVAFYEINRSFMVEINEPTVTAGKSGAIDYFAIDCTNIQCAFVESMNAGQKIVSDGIEQCPFWEHGVRFFIVEGPNKERVEFCQIV